MLTQPQVQRYAVESGLRDIMIAEKEVVLTFLLQLLSERGILDRLAFKGGTCLRKMFLGNQGRFSTDLDFTGLEEPGGPRPDRAAGSRTCRDRKCPVPCCADNRPEFSPRGFQRARGRSVRPAQTGGTGNNFVRSARAALLAMWRFPPADLEHDFAAALV